MVAVGMKDIPQLVVVGITSQIDTSNGDFIVVAVAVAGRATSDRVVEIHFPCLPATVKSGLRTRKQSKISETLTS